LLTLFLFAAAVLGGALNAVAGGGSFITLPALLYSGVSPVAANATNTFALWPGSLSSAWAYRRDIRVTRRQLVTLGAVSIIGGLIGGRLLVTTSDEGFLTLLPWLMLLAAATLSFGRHLLPKQMSPGMEPSVVPLLLMFLIAVYGGYFGGGMGIMTLAALSLAGMGNLHEMNGLKAVLAALIYGVALTEFVAHGSIAWTQGVVMVAGSVVGGYSAASLARRFDERYVRMLITVIAWALTIYFFVR
jgi:uncharacterized membrane protein YfcA